MASPGARSNPLRTKGSAQQASSVLRHHRGASRHRKIAGQRQLRPARQGLGLPDADRRCSRLGTDQLLVRGGVSARTEWARSDVTALRFGTERSVRAGHGRCSVRSARDRRGRRGAAPTSDCSVRRWRREAWRCGGWRGTAGVSETLADVGAPLRRGWTIEPCT